MYNWYAQLQRPLVLNSWTRGADSPPACLGRRGSRSRRGAHEVGRINLDLIAPTRTHLLEGCLSVLQKFWILDRPETNANAGCIRRGVRLDADLI